MYWMVIAFAPSPQVTNYLLLAGREENGTPEDVVNRMSVLGAGRSQLRGRGTRSEMENLATKLCPNPFIPPAGATVPPVPR
jgi:hypothetical protein